MTVNFMCLCKRKSRLYLKEYLDNSLVIDIPKHRFHFPHW